MDSGNRLEGATSPYLKAHATDPVAWRSWGEDAFAEARTRNVPILLSSGYASCHWCHVMQRETFRDPEVAEYLAKHFVAAKVDRELRPDVDGFYMDYVVALTGSGGWPLTVFLSPELVPFFGATYLPPRAVGDVPSFLDACAFVAEAWEAKDERLGDALAGARAFLSDLHGERPVRSVDRAQLDDAAERILRAADQEHGGIDGAPKFPRASLMRFMLAYHGISDDPGVLEVVSDTIRGMMRGGVVDHVGGGLFRYAVDEAWVVPHFEKMLGDSALFLSTLAGLHQRSPDERLAHIATDTARFILGSLAGPEGLLMSSLDADTDGIEGGTYVWRSDDLAGTFDEADMEDARRLLGWTAKGAFRGANVVQRATWPESDADSKSVSRLLAELARLRADRPQPRPITNVVTSLNGLAARGLIEAGVAFDDAAMLAAGDALLDAILDRCVDDDRVSRAPFDSDMSGLGFLDDAAAVVAALLSAHEASGDGARLRTASRLHAATRARFASGPRLFMTDENTLLPYRPREQQDDPTPSGASLHVENAIRLARVTGSDDELAFARAALDELWAGVEMSPESAGHALSAACMLVDDV